MPAYLPDRYPLFWFEARRRLRQRLPDGRWQRRWYVGTRVTVLLFLVLLVFGATFVLFRIWPDEEQCLAIYIALAFLPVLIAPGVAAWVITEERRKGTLNELLVMPISTRTLLGQKYAYLFLASMVIFGIFLPFTLPLLLQFPWTWVSVSSLLLAAVTCALACGLMMACSIHNSWTASSAAYVVIVALAAPLGPISGYVDFAQMRNLIFPIASAVYAILALLFFTLAVRALDRYRRNMDK